jgi:hypothetical protein
MHWRCECEGRRHHFERRRLPQVPLRQPPRVPPKQSVDGVFGGLKAPSADTHAVRIVPLRPRSEELGRRHAQRVNAQRAYGLFDLPLFQAPLCAVNRFALATGCASQNPPPLRSGQWTCGGTAAATPATRRGEFELARSGRRSGCCRSRHGHRHVSIRIGPLPAADIDTGRRAPRALRQGGLTRITTGTTGRAPGRARAFDHLFGCAHTESAHRKRSAAEHLSKSYSVISHLRRNRSHRGGQQFPAREPHHPSY